MRGVLLVVALHQALLWTAVLTGNPQATVTWDCVGGSMAVDALRGWAFSPLDGFDGILGGMFLASLAGLPLFAATGVTGLAVKGLSVTFAGAIVATAGLVWGRALGPLAGTLAAASVAFLPPVAFIASFMLGNWHFTEIGFELAITGALLGLVWGRAGAPLPTAPVSPGRAGLLGLLLGVAIFNCFATAVFIPVFYGLAWSTLRARVAWRALLAHGVGGVLGLAPLWVKVLFHAPFGVADGGSVRVPEEATNVGLGFEELQGFVNGAFQQGLHFGTALSTPQGTALSQGLAVAASVGLLGGWLLLALRTAPSTLALLRGALPGGTARPEHISPAVVPVLLSLVFLGALLASDMNLRRLPWYLSNPRDHDHIVLIPWLAQLALCAALLAASLWRERTSGAAPAGELAVPRRVGLAGLLPVGLVLATGAPSLAAFAVPDADAAVTSDAFRGSCWDVRGFMLAPHVDLDFPRGRELCARYGESEGWECSRGVAWAVGFFGAERSMERRGGPAEGACGPMPEPFRAECLRGLGWGFSSAAGGDVSEGAELAGLCNGVRPEEARLACWRGVGFPLGDHLGSSPPRFRRALQDLPERHHRTIVEGAGALLGRTYSSLETISALCEAWGPEVAEACRRGAEDSLSWRSPPGASAP